MDSVLVGSPIVTQLGIHRLPEFGHLSVPVDCLDCLLGAKSDEYAEHNYPHHAREFTPAVQRLW